MIVLGNSDFAAGMKLSGVKDSYAIKNKEEAIQIIKQIDKDEFILANVSIVKMVPELEERFKNLVSLPDDVDEFGNIDDLKHIIKSAVGIELEVE